MERKDIDSHMSEALSCPVLTRRLREVVKDIDVSVPRQQTKEMLYELVDIILQMGQRVRELERSTGYSDVKKELLKKECHEPRRKINYMFDFPRNDEKAKHD